MSLVSRKCMLFQKECIRGGGGERAKAGRVNQVAEGEEVVRGVPLVAEINRPA